MILTSLTEHILVKALDTAVLRHKAIAHNVANVNTPGYKRYEVRFEEKLNQALGWAREITLGRTHPKHLPAATWDLEPEVNREEFTTMRHDGNNVDIEREMVCLAQNSLDFDMALRQLGSRLAMWRYVINEGRR